MFEGDILGFDGFHADRSERTWPDGVIPYVISSRFGRLQFLPVGTNAIYGALTQPDALNRRKNDIQISGSIRMSVGHLTPSVTDGGRAATVLPPVECFAN